MKSTTRYPFYANFRPSPDKPGEYWCYRRHCVGVIPDSGVFESPFGHSDKLKLTVDPNFEESGYDVYIIDRGILSIFIGARSLDCDDSADEVLEFAHGETPSLPYAVFFIVHAGPDRTVANIEMLIVSNVSGVAHAICPDHFINAIRDSSTSEYTALDARRKIFELCEFFT